MTLIQDDFTTRWLYYKLPSISNSFDHHLPATITTYHSSNIITKAIDDQLISMVSGFAASLGLGLATLRIWMLGGDWLLQLLLLGDWLLQLLLGLQVLLAQGSVQLLAIYCWLLDSIMTTSTLLCSAEPRQQMQMRRKSSQAPQMKPTSMIMKQMDWVKSSVQQAQVLLQAQSQSRPQQSWQPQEQGVPRQLQTLQLQPFSLFCSLMQRPRKTTPTARNTTAQVIVMHRKRFLR